MEWSANVLLWTSHRNHFSVIRLDEKLTVNNWKMWHFHFTSTVAHILVGPVTTHFTYRIVTFHQVFQFCPNPNEATTVTFRHLNFSFLLIYSYSRTVSSGRTIHFNQHFKGPEWWIKVCFSLSWALGLHVKIWELQWSFKLKFIHLNWAAHSGQSQHSSFTLLDVGSVSLLKNTQSPFS